MKFKPLNDRLLVQRVQRESKTAGGIIIPDTVTEKPSEGIVVAAGPGKRNDSGARTELQVKSGDRILFGKYAGTEVQLSGEDYLIMREDDVLAVVEAD